MTDSAGDTREQRAFYESELDAADERFKDLERRTEAEKDNFRRHKAEMEAQIDRLHHELARNAELVRHKTPELDRHPSGSAEADLGNLHDHATRPTHR